MLPEQPDSVLNRATPLPWGRDEWGNLIGANGEAIYFAGVDSVLVEYAPMFLKCLMDIRRETAINDKDPLRRIKSIQRWAESTIAEVANHPFCCGATQSRPPQKPGPQRNTT
jgi:hypothetical protein